VEPITHLGPTEWVLPEYGDNPVSETSCFKKDRTTDNFQNCNSYIPIPSRVIYYDNQIIYTKIFVFIFLSISAGSLHDNAYITH
jgi:hypothetical protein